MAEGVCQGISLEDAGQKWGPFRGYSAIEEAPEAIFHQKNGDGIHEFRLRFMRAFRFLRSVPR